MSNSYKKEPYYSCNAGSFKSWKRGVNGILRSRSKIRINTCKDWDELIMPTLDECGSYWDSPKDGRSRRQKKPALNQCIIDSQKYLYLWGFYSSRYEVNPDGHREICVCYTNKKTCWYWKMIRK